MLKILLSKCKEALVSVLPVTLIVVILHMTPLISLTNYELAVFLICSFFLVLGIGLFNLGADLAMTPMGEHVGSGLARSRNLFLLLSVCFVMGLLITVAEPDLSVLASQVAGAINGTALIAFVGIGVGLFLVLAVLKMAFHINLSSLLMFFYMLLFALASLVAIGEHSSFLSLAFDSGGVTTGPITVPFIMALGVGIASTLGGKDVSENSFGLVAMCSVGPILAVMALGLTIKDDIPSPFSEGGYSVGTQVDGLLHTVIDLAKEVALALGLIVVFFLILQMVFLHLPRKKLGQIAVGLIYTFLGLVVFLAAVTVGFMPVGYRLGTMLGELHPALLVGFSFLLGLVVVLAEPAVHVLNKQVETITDGTVSKKSMMIALSVGVGISIALSLIRIWCGFSILYYLVPGYFISLGLSFFVPRIYTAIAFDSGGVASGPLTSSFILPFAVGACATIQGPDSVLGLAFGVVAMVAMTPLITIQLLGFRAVVAQKVRRRIAMRRILDAEDEQIIRFM